MGGSKDIDGRDEIKSGADDYKQKTNDCRRYEQKAAAAIVAVIVSCMPVNPVGLAFAAGSVVPSDVLASTHPSGFAVSHQPFFPVQRAATISVSPPASGNRHGPQRYRVAIPPEAV